MKYNPPPPIPNPKHAAENRARLLSWLMWTVAVLPLLFMLMAYGYSDQAPAFLRSFTAALDGAFGAPVWTILRLVVGR